MRSEPCRNIISGGAKGQALRWPLAAVWMQLRLSAMLWRGAGQVTHAASLAAIGLAEDACPIVPRLEPGAGNLPLLRAYPR